MQLVKLYLIRVINIHNCKKIEIYDLDRII